jgi:hypothetical protein
VLLIGPYGVMGAALATTLGTAVDAIIRGAILIQLMHQEAVGAKATPGK